MPNQVQVLLLVVHYTELIRTVILLITIKVVVAGWETRASLDQSF